MRRVYPNNRWINRLSALVVSALFVSLPEIGIASVTVDHTASPFSESLTRLALKEQEVDLPDDKPAGQLTIPETEGGFGPSLPVDPPTLDTLETDVPDEEPEPQEQVNVTIEYDLTKLPEPVGRMRELIIKAAETGDIEELRSLLGTGISQTELSIGGFDGDPIDFLKQNSGDGEGLEVLAILLDILQAGYAHLDQGEPEEIYLWPYFYSVPIDGLDDRQMVELYRIVTAGDYEDMQAFGSYIFYRTAITPDGQWKFFVAGD